jgi:hypothetical protein
MQCMISKEDTKYLETKWWHIIKIYNYSKSKAIFLSDLTRQNNWLLSNVQVDDIYFIGIELAT